MGSARRGSVIGRGLHHNGAMAFAGWPVEAIEFYEGLQADNSKVYWQRHKEIYTTCVKAPMEQLLGELAAEFGPAKLFRPYRDVRFSADKTPYKTNCAAQLGLGYVSLAADGLSVGGGIYQPDPATLRRYRAAVDAEESGAVLAEIVADLRGAGFTTIAHDALKTAPRGFTADHPRIELLRLKGIATMKTFLAGAWLGTARAKDRVVTGLRTAGPLIAWLDRYVG